jgi:hypothetical protein
MHRYTESRLRELDDDYAQAMTQALAGAAGL